MTYLIFSKFFKCIFVTLIGYFLYPGEKLNICFYGFSLYVDYISYEFCFC